MTFKKTDTFTKKKDKGKKWFEILITLTVSSISFQSGMLYCWPSPFLVKIVQDEHYDITEEQASYFTVLGQIGVIILSPFLAPLTNRIGRKKIILFAAVPYIISWIIKAFCTQLWLLYASRVIAGFGDSVVFSCAMAFIGEVTSPEVRGIWGNSLILSGFLGQFAINLLGIYFTVQITSFISMTVPILFLIIFSLMPESPYFYLAKGQEDRAKDSLRRLRRKENVHEEFKALQVAVENQQTGTGSWMELVTVKLNRKVLSAGIFLRMTQIFAGIYTFASYTLLIFKKSGTNISPEMATIFYTAFNFVCYSSAVYMSNKLGRRRSLITSMVLTGIVLLSLGIYFLVEIVYPEMNLEVVKWFPLAGMIGYVLSSSFGVGILPSLMLGEIFPVSTKSKGMAVVTCAFAVMTFCMNNVFYYLNSYIGLCGPFLLFGVANFVAAFMTYYIIPETKDKSLEEIQQEFRRM